MRLKSKVTLFSSVLCVLGLLTVSSIPWILPKENGSSGMDLFLARPAFAQEVDTSAFPGDEAGISAYVNVGQNMDLKQAKTAFIGLIDEGDDYVIGTVEIEKMPEEAYPHVYVNQNGWILAYYTKNSPSSLIMQWYVYEGGPITTTTLRDAIFNTCVAIRIDFSKIADKVGYYHFQYPEATKMLLVADLAPAGSPEDSFTYMIPLNVTLFEASWSHYDYGSLTGESPSYGVRTVYIDGKVVDEFRGYPTKGKPWLKYAECESAYTVPGAVHTVRIEIDCQGFAMAFIYK
jgi:hypothetical protein